MSYCHVFGPVISSRLDRSLGLDLLAMKQPKQETLQRGQAAKVCSFDCVYCEVGPNPQRRLERDRFALPQDILQELKHWCEQHKSPLDYVTLGGSGEPCLHIEMGEIIRQVRKLLPHTPVAVLTNASLLPDPQVRGELALADAVLPSLDSLVPEEFQRCNRPHPLLDIAAIAEALLQFRREYEGLLYLEVLLCAGVNDSDANLQLLTDYVARLQPDRVDVVTLSRPGAYAQGRAVDAATLQRFRQQLEPLACKRAPQQQRQQRADAVALRVGEQQEGHSPAALAEEVYQSLRRRPQTAPQLAQALDAPVTSVEAAVRLLKQEHRLQALSAASQQEPVFFKAL